MTNREAVMARLNDLDDEEFAEWLAHMCRHTPCLRCPLAHVDCPESTISDQVYDWLDWESAEND